ncbi:hypothetical protein B484DRAFT_433915 [Ochromonadaceae sp. CCMP2298]|nr:hypothetical protein B484DRAFT_433915 [Ochromonadaceae sp. CCMP2298]
MVTYSLEDYQARKDRAVFIANKHAVTQNPPTEVEKHNANGMAHVLLAGGDPSQDASKGSSLLDVLAQCAEDSCTSFMLQKLDELVASGASIHKITATWVATHRNKETKQQENFALCDFCKVRFEERTRILLSHYIIPPVVQRSMPEMEAGV